MRVILLFFNYPTPFNEMNCKKNCKSLFKTSFKTPIIVTKKTVNSYYLLPIDFSTIFYHFFNNS